MKNLFIIANWKSNKTIVEAKNWLQEVSSIRDKEIIVCPPFTLFSDVKSYIIDHKLPINLGAQDISPFEEGPYTGEVSGRQLAEFVDYVIIGHSERQTFFQENEEMLLKKVAMARKYNLIPIFCIQDEKTELPNSVEIVAYEPSQNIGTGLADNPEDVEKIAKLLKEQKQARLVLYGGSVNSQNVKSFTSLSSVDGVLVGTESLDAQEFVRIITNA